MNLLFFENLILIITKLPTKIIIKKKRNFFLFLNTNYY